MDDVGRRDHALPATTFAHLPLRQELQRALRTMRFHAPSPIQLRALPLALFGSDVIGQAKSGTGKTAVFGLAAVEHVLQRAPSALAPSDPLVLVLAPTREIAMQIDSVLRELAADCGDLHIVPLIGGLPIAQDQKRLRAGCHIAVGTPGRVRWLMEDGVFRPKSIRLLVFDEVDKLLSGEFVQDIDAIVAPIPERRQTLAFSATFTPDQLVHVVRMMRDPQVVRVRGPNDVTVELVPSQEDELAAWIEREKQHEPELWLRHVRQFYRVVPTKTDVSSDPLNLKSKLVLLASLLSEIAFRQCIVFCNDKFRAEALATALASQGWPAAAITGAQTQTTRNAVMAQFRGFALRVLVSTDLTARGIDVDKVNFVVNLDLPRDPATYLHRVGRTGRFGGKHGLAVTLLTASEVEGIHLLSRVFRMSVDALPSPVPRDICDYVAGVHNAAAVTNGSGARDDDDGSEGDGGVTRDRGHVDAGEEEVEELEELRAAKDPRRSDGSDVKEASDQVVHPRLDEAQPACQVASAAPRMRHDLTDASPLEKSAAATSAGSGATTAMSRAFAREDRCYAQWLRLT